MKSFLKSMMRESYKYFEPPTVSNRRDFTFGAAIDIKCYAVEKIENVVKDNVIVKEKQSIIYTLTEIKAGGYVCKSSEYSTTTNVLDYDMIKQVVSYKDIKGNVVYYKAIL
ncbi:MAG: hypothetical protein KA799_03945 [Bacteroidales bacterium]|nr:hypothetical protein [Bacteroidales bacterium]